MASNVENWYSGSDISQSQPVKPHYHRPVVITKSESDSELNSLNKQQKQPKQSLLSRLPWIGRYFKTYNDWHPGWLAQFPWTAFGCIFGVIGLSACNLSIIYKVNGQSPDIPESLVILIGPNVLLNIINHIIPMLMALAVAQALAISWWRSAMKGPVTVEELHVFWSFSSSLTSIIKNPKSFNVIAFTFLVTKLGLIDSSLYQKSLSTELSFTEPFDLNVIAYPANTFPYTGSINQQANDTSSMRYSMTWEFAMWMNSGFSLDVNILQGFDCVDLCELTYRGIGFWSNCSYADISDISRSPEAVAAGYNTLFDLEFNQRWPTPEKNYSYIEMNWAAWNPSNSVSKAGQSCMGSYQNLTCELRPAIIDYPIAISNYSLYLGKVDMTNGDWDGTSNANFNLGNISSGHQLPNHKLVQWLDIAESRIPGSQSNLGGIVTSLRTVYNAHSSVAYVSNQLNSNSSSSVNNTGLVSNVVASGSTAWIMQQEDVDNGCPVGYDRPLEISSSKPSRYSKIIYAINLLMILISDDYENRSNYTSKYGVADKLYEKTIRSEIGATQAMRVTIYRSNMKLAWIAFGSTVLMIVLILPGFYGYWELGRRVSLDPLEMANAFDAPILKEHDTGAGHVAGLLANARATKVQYNRESNGYEMSQRYHFKPAENQPVRMTFWKKIMAYFGKRPDRRG